MHISSTKKYTLVSLLFFLGSVGVTVFMLNMITREGMKLEDQMQTIGENNLIAKQYEDLQASLLASEQDRAVLNSYLLTEGQTVHFLSDIETFAKQLSLELITDSLTVNPVPNKDFQKIDLKFRVSGSKEQLLTFVSLLETLPYYSRLEAMTLKQQSNEGWSATLTLMVGLHTYD